jgi:hypothetical protein
MPVKIQLITVLRLFRLQRIAFFEAGIGRLENKKAARKISGGFSGFHSAEVMDWLSYFAEFQKIKLQALFLLKDAILCGLSGSTRCLPFRK